MVDVLVTPNELDVGYVCAFAIEEDNIADPHKSNRTVEHKKKCFIKKSP